MATLLHAAVMDLNYTQRTWRWLKLYNVSVVPSHLRSTAPTVNVRRSRILLQIDGAEFSSRGAKSEQTFVGIHFTGRWSKHTRSGARVGSTHRALAVLTEASCVRGTLDHLLLPLFRHESIVSYQRLGSDVSSSYAIQSFCFLNISQLSYVPLEIDDMKLK